jgi:hypothetical protein
MIWRRDRLPAIKQMNQAIGWIEFGPVPKRQKKGGTNGDLLVPGGQ